ncbi:hypothetical protein HDU67_006516 [Dinochytrium kinnereticum]|nr:hypothetical protein HDU67_006516 [Dinochytrium kinnereticum]
MLASWEALIEDGPVPQPAFRLLDSFVASRKAAENSPKNPVIEKQNLAGRFKLKALRKLARKLGSLQSLLKAIDVVVDKTFVKESDFISVGRYVQVNANVIFDKKEFGLLSRFFALEDLIQSLESLRMIMNSLADIVHSRCNGQAAVDSIENDVLTLLSRCEAINSIRPGLRTASDAVNSISIGNHLQQLQSTLLSHVMDRIILILGFASESKGSSGSTEDVHTLNTTYHLRRSYGFLKQPSNFFSTSSQEPFLPNTLIPATSDLAVNIMSKSKPFLLYLSKSMSENTLEFKYSFDTCLNSPLSISGLSSLSESDKKWHLSFKNHLNFLHRSQQDAQLIELQRRSNIYLNKRRQLASKLEKRQESGKVAEEKKKTRQREIDDFLADRKTNLEKVAVALEMKAQKRSQDIAASELLVKEEAIRIEKEYAAKFTEIDLQTERILWSQKRQELFDKRVELIRSEEKDPVAFWSEVPAMMFLKEEKTPASRSEDGRDSSLTDFHSDGVKKGLTMSNETVERQNNVLLSEGSQAQPATSIAHEANPILTATLEPSDYAHTGKVLPPNENDNEENYPNEAFTHAGTTLIPGVSALPIPTTEATKDMPDEVKDGEVPPITAKQQETTKAEETGDDAKLKAIASKLLIPHIARSVCFRRALSARYRQLHTSVEILSIHYSVLPVYLQMIGDYFLGNNALFFENVMIALLRDRELKSVQAGLERKALWDGILELLRKDFSCRYDVACPIEFQVHLSPSSNTKEFIGGIRLNIAFPESPLGLFSDSSTKCFHSILTLLIHLGFLLKRLDRIPIADRARCRMFFQSRNFIHDLLYYAQNLVIKSNWEAFQKHLHTNGLHRKGETHQPSIVKVYEEFTTTLFWSLFAHPSQTSILDVVMALIGIVHQYVDRKTSKASTGGVAASFETTLGLFRQIVENVADRGDAACSANFYMLRGLME